MTTAARKLLAALALGAVACTMSAQAGERLDKINETKVIRVGTPADYRPFAMKEGEKLVGHDVDLIESMAKTAGWKVE